MKIACFGNFGVKNIGDDLILMGLLEVLQDHELVVFCGNPEQVKAQFDLKSHVFFPSGIRSLMRYLFSSSYRQEIREGSELLQNCDRIVIGGGGILVDRFWKAIFLWWRQLSAIRRSGKSYEFMANSFELKSCFSRMIFLPFLKGAEKISVRDTASKEFIESLGLRAELVSDLSAHVSLRGVLRSRTTKQSHDLGHGAEMHEIASLPSVARNDKKKKICFALCRWGLGKPQQQTLRAFINARRREGWDIIGLALATIGDDDREILKAIDPNLRIETELRPILQELVTSKLLLGMRLHSLIFASRLEIPMIALAHQDKITAFMKDQGKSSQVIPIQDVSLESLQVVFEALI